jgi:hypothetical protein
MMQDERRATIRHRTLKGGKIALNEGFSVIDCTVRNLSTTGAMLRVTSVVGIPDAFQLVMSDGQKFDCVVQRRTGTDIGVSFQPAA